MSDISTIRNISDTALWAAVFRARETERPDALFRDPFARRLGGERGETITKSISFSDKSTWAWITRTWIFDRFITQEIARGGDMVLNLAAGLDARPYRMTLPRTLRWVEVDLPGILDYKEDILAAETPNCTLERVRMDLADGKARRELFARLATQAQNALVTCEGLIIYLTAAEVGSLAEDLAVVPGFTRWATDVASPGLLKMLQKTVGPHLGGSGAVLQFGPREGPEFFAPHGWVPLEIVSTLDTAAQLKRLSFGMRLLAMLPASNGRRGARPWSAGILLGKKSEANR